MTIPTSEPYCPACGLRVYTDLCGCCRWEVNEHVLTSVTEPPSWLKVVPCEGKMTLRSRFREVVFSALSDWFLEVQKFAR